jgi:hypothetical protein
MAGRGAGHGPWRSLDADLLVVTYVIADIGDCAANWYFVRSPDIGEIELKVRSEPRVIDAASCTNVGLLDNYP